MDLFSESSRRDPYPIHAHLRDHAPVLHLPAQQLWVVSRYDAVSRVLTDHDAFSSRVSPLRGHNFEWLLFLDPPRHTALRGLVSRAFTPRSIAGLEPRIRELSRSLLDPVMDRGELDLVAEYATPLPLLVIAEMIGLPTSDHRRLARWGEAIMNLGDTISGTDAARAAAEFRTADAEMLEHIGALVRERRARPAEDLVSRLAGAGLEDLECVRFCQLLLAAGTETTTNLVDNAILCLAEHPHELARLRADPGLLPGAIEEVLRFRTPVQAMFRATTREIEIDGVMIPPQAFVLAGIGAANRDPRCFSDADRFDITRAPNPHIAFGHGIHFCLGAALSRLEATIAIGDLLARFESFEVARDWSPRRAFHVHGPAALRLRFRTRS